MITKAEAKKRIQRYAGLSRDTLYKRLDGNDFIKTELLHFEIKKDRMIVVDSFIYPVNEKIIKRK